MSRQIGRHAPYLRRYARALTGSQAKGDSLVQGAMEGLLSGDIQLQESLPVRSALYSALHDAWRRGETVLEPSVTGADQRLQTLSGDERAALLLTSMDGFSSPEAGDILPRDSAEV